MALRKRPATFTAATPSGSISSVEPGSRIGVRPANGRALMSKIFKSLFCAAVAAVPLSYVTFVHAVSALGDQEWRTLAVPDFGTRVQYRRAFSRTLTATRRRALASV
jgi:hypothetical protein